MPPSPPPKEKKGRAHTQHLGIEIDSILEREHWFACPTFHTQDFKGPGQFIHNDNDKQVLGRNLKWFPLFLAYTLLTVISKGIVNRMDVLSK